MKKMHSFAYSALAVSVMAVGASPVLAQLEESPPPNQEQTVTSEDQDARVAMPQEERQGPSETKPAPEMNKQRSGSPATPAASDHKQSQTGTGSVNPRGGVDTKQPGYLGSAPKDGTHASALIGATVTTLGDEEIGVVSDLIIDANGHVVAVVVGVGGFLGIGEKNVAIGWTEITKPKNSDDRDLRVKATREALEAAPEFASRD